MRLKVFLWLGNRDINKWMVRNWFEIAKLIIFCWCADLNPETNERKAEKIKGETQYFIRSVHTQHRY